MGEGGQPLANVLHLDLVNGWSGDATATGHLEKDQEGEGNPAGLQGGPDER